MRQWLVALALAVALGGPSLAAQAQETTPAPATEPPVQEAAPQGTTEAQPAPQETSPVQNVQPPPVLPPTPVAATTPIPVPTPLPLPNSLAGSVIVLRGTEYIWVMDATGVLHWVGDTRA